MKLVPENINEAIKHLTPKSKEELSPMIRERIYNFIDGHFYGNEIDENRVGQFASWISEKIGMEISTDIVKEVIDTFPKGKFKLTYK